MNFDIQIRGFDSQSEARAHKFYEGFTGAEIVMTEIVSREQRWRGDKPYWKRVVYNGLALRLNGKFLRNNGLFSWDASQSPDWLHKKEDRPLQQQ